MRSNGDGNGIERGGEGKAKEKGKGKVLKRKQRIRVERGKDRAEVVGDKVERKMGKERRGGSGGRGVGRGVSLNPFFLLVLFLFWYGFSVQEVRGGAGTDF